MIWTDYTPITLMIASMVNGEKINGVNYKSCFEKICIPDAYKANQMPAVTNFTVYMNIEIPANGNSRNEEGLEKIDVHKMMLTYTPRIIMAWQDPRLLVDSNETSFLLSSYHLQKIWIPRITVIGRSQLTTGFMDYGKTGILTHTFSASGISSRNI